MLPGTMQGSTQAKLSNGGVTMRAVYLLTGVFMLTMALCAERTARAQDYVLGEGDLLNISVYDNADLTTQARVSGGGVINFPLVGEAGVSGLTVREAEVKLAGMLANGFLREPHVTVFVAEYRSKKVTILGEVGKPGLYELTGNVTLVEMISRAGGLTADAGDTLSIQHKSPGPEQPGAAAQEIIDMNRLMREGDLSANIAVQDGDSIFINKSGYVYVTGEVNHPGSYKMDKDTTVMKAIALAGGLTGIAAPGRTCIIRKSDGKEYEMRVEMNYTVQADDVISVPESIF